MKLFVYNYRDFDEGEFFRRYAKEFGVELGFSKEEPTLETAHLAKGYDCLSIITTQTDAALLEKFHELGIKMISTRTIGYDHIDLDKATELGLEIANAAYSPHCVADYTVMLMLMCIRKMKRIMDRANINDFSLPGIQGGEMPNYTVGVIGSGKIGQTVIRYLSGFGCKIYAYDPYENEETKKYAQYVSLETIYEKCDIITLHAPLTEENTHLISRTTLAKMKDGVILINTARGALIDSEALIEGVVNGKVGAAGLDVIEKESGLYYNDLKSEVVDNRELIILRSFPNVIFTPHLAFYTDQAIDDMVHHSIKSCQLFMDGEKNPWKVN